MYRRVNELLGTRYNSNEEIDWCYISSYQFSLSESFIREFKDKIDWSNISFCQSLSEPFIEEFKDKVKWRSISRNQELSESFIKKFSNSVDWRYISSYQVLSESFIREFKDKVSWENISYNQVLSWNFILEFKNKVNWDCISSIQPFIDPSYEKINKVYLENNNFYHLYQQTKDRDWFIGYYLGYNNETRKRMDFDLNLSKFTVTNPRVVFYIKAKIYWKDLKILQGVNKFEIIRKFKNV